MTTKETQGIGNSRNLLQGMSMGFNVTNTAFFQDSTDLFTAA
jgi:hypothetical protein